MEPVLPRKVYTARIQPRTKKTVTRLRVGRVLSLALPIVIGLAALLIAVSVQTQQPHTQTYAQGSELDTFYIPPQETDTTIDSKPQVQGESISTAFRHKNYLTSALIVGVDSRNVTLENGEFINTRPEGQSGTRNTDTIMQIVYDHHSGEAFMISIPRDIGVDLVLRCMEFHGSIHWVYDRAERANCDIGGAGALKQAVTTVTGIPIQYHIFVTLDAFHEIVDIVGEEQGGKKGVWVDNPYEFWEVYPYNDYGWENVYFPEGRQFMDSDRAIRYVRSRQFTQDWGRAERQQIFIEAVKDRLLSTDTLLNPAKILELIGIFQDKLIISELSFGEILELVGIIQSVDTSNIVNVILSPDFGGSNEVLLNKQPHGRPGGPYYMVPTHWYDCPGNEYCEVQDFISGIISHPRVYTEQPRIAVYSTQPDENGNPSFASIPYQGLLNANLPLTIEQQSALSNITATDPVIVIDYADGEDPYTLATLKSITGSEPLPSSVAPSANPGNHDIVIIVNP